MSDKKTKATDDTIDVEIRDKKSERFFAHLNELEDFIVTVYKEGEKNKRVKMEVFENVVPNDMTDIRDVHGPGTYHLYCHALSEGKIGELLDYTMVHLGGRPEISSSQSQKTNEQSLAEKAQELMVFKQLFSQNENNGVSQLADSVSKMMQAQQEMAIRQANMMNEQLQQMVQYQLESEKRMSRMMEKLHESKNNTNELLQTIELIDSIRSGGDNQNMLEKIMTGPLGETMIKSFMEKTPEGPIPQISDTVPARESKPDFTPNEYAANIPPEIKEKINSDTRAHYKKIIMKNNSLTEVFVDNILDIIISENEHKKNTNNEVI